MDGAHRVVGPVADVAGLAAALWIPVAAAVVILAAAPLMTGVRSARRRVALAG